MFAYLAHYSPVLFVPCVFLHSYFLDLFGGNVQSYKILLDQNVIFLVKSRSLNVVYMI